MKLVEVPSPQTIPAARLRCGQIAIIRQWGGCPEYKGRIVQRHKNTIVTLGHDADASWTPADSISELCRVEVLPPGTTLEV